MTKGRGAGMFLVVAFALGATCLQAQPRPAAFDARRLDVPRDLDEGWLVKAGDDPAYAHPGFNDSGWMPFKLDSPLGTALGAHPQVVWYRLKVDVDSGQTGLALREETLATAFEVYVNGERLMASGRFNPMRSYTYNAITIARIPDRMVATGHLEVALRVGISGEDWLSSDFPGLSAGNITLGPDATLVDKAWLEVMGKNLTSVLDWVTTIGLGFVALTLFLSQRQRREYLWIFGLGMTALAQLPIRVICLFYNIPIGWRFLSAAFAIANPLLLVSMYFAFVNLRVGWKFRIFLWIAGIFNAYNILASQGLVRHPLGNYALLGNLPFVILLSVVIPIFLGVHWRRGNREAGILLIPAIAFSLFIYLNYTLALLVRVPAWSETAGKGLKLIQQFPIGPIAFSLNDVMGILSTIALAVIMVLRSSRTSRMQAMLEGELEAAREVQQVILPEKIDSIPGFTIESVYEPAQQVGGDFFQIVPTGDGGLLLVLGDVAGKGLPAAMLVSVMVGAIRATAEFTHAPQEILASLNERLFGRTRGGFSTALAAYLSPGGAIEIANAGHLSPYIDGREWELPGALPLGILSGCSYRTVHGFLSPGSRITFYSDGVIEAQNAKGELFGFDRSQEIATQPAAEIAAVAKRFGQTDDITVVAITRAII